MKVDTFAKKYPTYTYLGFMLPFVMGNYPDTILLRNATNLNTNHFLRYSIIAANIPTVTIIGCLN